MKLTVVKVHNYKTTTIKRTPMLNLLRLDLATFSLLTLVCYLSIFFLSFFVFIVFTTTILKFDVMFHLLRILLFLLLLASSCLNFPICFSFTFFTSFSAPPRYDGGKKQEKTKVDERYIWIHTHTHRHTQLL